MFKNRTVFDCSLIEIPKIKDRSGNSTAIENNIHIPFAINRVFYLYDIDTGLKYYV